MHLLPSLVCKRHESQNSGLTCCSSSVMFGRGCESLKTVSADVDTRLDDNPR